MAKGKQGTKGAKQIVEENISTLNFYRNMAFGATVASLVALYLFQKPVSFFLYLFSTLVYIASYRFMVYVAKPKYSDSKQLIDPGADLNMEGAISENVKDIIILTAGCQLLSIISNYFWLLWLLAPIRGGWLLWKGVLNPYLQQKNEEPEVNEKKKKKMERMMKRMRQ